MLKALAQLIKSQKRGEQLCILIREGMGALNMYAIISPQARAGIFAREVRADRNNAYI